MAETLDIALVGCGGMGMRHLAAYAEMELAAVPWVRLVAVCDGDPDRLAAAVAEFERRTGRRLLAFDTIDEADGAGVQAVDLALPTWLHHTVAADAFARGLHVLVEKPLALTIGASRTMIDAAGAADRVLAVSENFRRIPANRAFRQLIADGHIGRPYWTSSEFSFPADEAPSRWYRDRRRAGSLVALEMGVHETDLLAYWFGPIERVDALVRTFEPQIHDDAGEPVTVTSDDTCMARIELASGVVAQVTMTMAGHGRLFGRRHAVGSLGSVSSDRWEAWDLGELTLDDQPPVPMLDLTAKYVDGLDAERREHELPAGTFRVDDLSVDVTEPLRYGVATSIVDFARAALTGDRPEVGGPEALASLGAAIAMLESTASGGPVAVEDVLNGNLDAWQREIDIDL